MISNIRPIELVGFVGGGSVPVGPGNEVPLRIASAIDSRSIHSGHSLTDSYAYYGPYPYNLANLAESIGVQDAYDKLIRSTVAGSSIQYRFENDASLPNGARAFSQIGQFDTLTITENGPPPHVNDDANMLNTMDYFCRFAANTIENGRGNEVILWSIWPSLNGAGWPYTFEHWTGTTFREALPEYEDSFQFMAEYTTWKMRQLYPSLPADWRVWMFPGNRWMLRVYDDIAAELVPGITDIDELFSDDIHPNPTGAYGLACFVTTCLYQVNLTAADDPFIMPAYTDVASVEHPAVPQALAEYFWQIAWEIANDYHLTGMGGTSGSTPRWTLEANGDIMPFWTLADPDTSQPEEPIEPVLPEDLLGTVRPEDVTGYSFSPALPAPDGEGWRSISALHLSATPNAIYMAMRLRRTDSSAPTYAALGTNTQTWVGRMLGIAAHGGWAQWLAVEQPSGVMVPDTDHAIDDQVHTIEVWQDTANQTVYISVDGGTVYSNAVEADLSAFSYLTINPDTAAFDFYAVTTMDRIPTINERAGIRQALAEAMGD